MPRIDISFLLLSAICLLVGVCLGIYMGIRHDFQLAPVHAHLNLLGWASLALFGLTYRLYPDLMESRLAAVHFWLSAPSAVMFPFGIYLSMLHESPQLAIAASLLWLGGAMAFLAGLVGLAMARPALRAMQQR